MYLKKKEHNVKFWVAAAKIKTHFLFFYTPQARIYVFKPENKEKPRATFQKIQITTVRHDVFFPLNVPFPLFTS